MDTLELKPNKIAFVYYPSLKTAVILMTIFLLLVLLAPGFLSGSVLLLVLVAMGLVILLRFASRSVAYGKTRYVFMRDKIVYETGGILFNTRTELTVRNITHVMLVRPFIENKLFGTGHVIIEAAGAAGAEVRAMSVDEPRALYQLVQNMMKDAGFSMDDSKLIRHEKPAHIAALLETLGIVLFVLFFIGVYGFGFIAVFITGVGILGIMLLLTILLILFFLAIVHYLDLINRDYWIYGGMIVYDEGFLTKVDSFLPIENLSDSNTTQSFVDRLFNLYDVTVSCQGTGQEIHFKNISNGLQMEKDISNLIQGSESLIGEKSKIRETPRLAIESERSELSVDTSFEKELRVDYRRAMGEAMIISTMISAALITMFTIPGLFIIGVIFSIPVYIIAFILASIRISANRFSIKSKSFASRYMFLHTTDLEFSNEKVTGIQFNEGILDRMFGTFSVIIMSIGATSDMRFINIPSSEELKRSILAKVGISDEELIYATQSEFSIGELFKANLPLMSIFIGLLSILVYLGLNETVFMLIAILLLVITVVYIIYLSLFYATSKLYFHKNYIHAKRGVINKTDIFALYDDIKDNETKRYAFSDKGTVRFNIAGEYVRQEGKKRSIVTHGFSVNYVPAIAGLDEVIDLAFTKKPDSEEMKKIISGSADIPKDVIASSKPHVLNTIFGFLLFLIIVDIAAFYMLFMGMLPLHYVPALLVIEVICLVIRALQITKITFYLEPYRLIASWGLLYKSQKSVVFSKIDHINKRQGPLNRLFGTGTITVNTAGSSTPELVLRNLKDYNEFFRILEGYYL